MLRRPPSRWAGSFLAAVAGATAWSGPAAVSAAPAPTDVVVVTGSLDYSTVPPGQVVESVATNSVELSFSPAGGPFTGVASLDLVHDVPDRGCRFTSTHRWEFSGEFAPGTRQFVGDYREVAEATQGACENFTFTRTFDPDEARFIADVDPSTGVITSRIEPLDFMVSADPSLFESMLPEAVDDDVLTEILDEIAGRFDPITASGPAQNPPTGDDVTVQSNRIDVVFDPFRGAVVVSGVVEFETGLVFGDGQPCTMTTAATIGGEGRYDPVTGAIAGTSQTEFDRGVMDCDVTVDPTPIAPGTIDLFVDPGAGEVRGTVGAFDVAAVFDPTVLPREPDDPFQIDLLSYALDGNRLRIAIDWKVPWPPPEVGSLLVAGELVTDDVRIVFGHRIDEGSPSTFMEPAGGYTAFVDERGRSIIDVELPGLDTVGGPILVMRTWHADTADDPGSAVAIVTDTVDPARSPIVDEPVERIGLPFDLPAFWADPTSFDDEPDAAAPADTPPPDDAEGDPDEAAASVVSEPIAAAPSDDDGGGFPWALLLIPVVGIGVGGAIVFWRRRAARAKDAGAPTAAAGGCGELERQWRAAQDECDRHSDRAEELSRSFDAREEDRARAQAELDDLPSAETRVELPDGTTMSERDLDLRRRASAAAWDAYMADPTPESARAAEDAWNQQATPEWREEQRRLDRATRDRLAGEADAARAERERIGAELAAARERQREACERAAAARRALDDCLQQAQAAPPAGEGATPPAPEPPAPAPPDASETAPPPPEEAVPVPTPPGAGPAPPTEGGAPGDGGCEEGDERWVEFDGPHPFTLPVDDEVTLRVQLIAGTRRYDRVGSLDRSDFVVRDGRGRARSIPLDSFAGLTPDAVTFAFSGQGGLAEVWEAAGTGGDQRIVIGFSVRTRRAMAYCIRKERCVDGEWVPTGERRTRVVGEVETVSDGATVAGNLQPGLGRSEADCLAEVAAPFLRMQGHVIRLIDQADTFARYQQDCRGGKR